MNEKIKIRIAEESELEFILDIINDTIETTTNDYRYDKINISGIKEWYRNHIKNAEPVLVALLNNIVIGYATYSKFRDRIGFHYSVEHSIYCHRDYKYKGIGKLLMNELINYAKNNGKHTMIACIDSENKNSISFHEKLGFTYVGKMKDIGFKFNRFLDMIMMQLILV